jgi:hypothetical protein
MPEHFVEDPIELLQFASHIAKGFDIVNLLIFQTYGTYVSQSLCVTLDACHGTSVLNIVA